MVCPFLGGTRDRLGTTLQGAATRSNPWSYFFFAAIAAVAYTARVCETSIAGTTGITAYKVEGMIRNASRLMFQHQDEINDAVTVTFL